MKDFSKLKDDVAWLIGQVKCLFSMFPSSTTWTDKHSGTTGNKYLKDQIVWYNGFIYKCLVDNNGNPTNNTFYWQKMGRGWLIQQEQADWDATGGPAFIRNKPTSLGGGTESDPIFQAWLDTNPLSGYLTSESDPVFAAWQLANDNHGNWDTAYGWGDHSNLYLLLDGTATMLPDAPINFANASKLSEGSFDQGTGGNKGIALTCSIGYEWKWEAGEGYLRDQSGYIRIKQYARSLPNIGDDASKGFVVGSLWYQDQHTLYYYICIDATTGAAVWEQRYPEVNFQQVTDVGYITTNPIVVTGLVGISDLGGNLNSGLNTINDQSGLGVGWLMVQADLGMDIRVLYHPDYFIPQVPFTAPSRFYIPYKIQGTYTLATTDDIADASAANSIILNNALALKQNNLKTFNRTQGVYYFEEFMGNNAGSVPTSYNTVITLSSGNATARSVATTNRTNQQGIIQHSTGTGASNFTGYAYGSSLYIGSGTISLETYLTVETLSTVTERFMTYFGYAGGSSNYLNIPSGIFFSYDEGGVVFSGGITTPNWKCYTRVASGAVTVTTTSTVVNANQWYKLRIDINAAGTSVTFFINDVLVATHTTNIPSSTTVIAPISIIHKSAGTTARTMLTDYFMYEEIFTNAR